MPDDDGFPEAREYRSADRSRERECHMRNLQPWIARNAAGAAANDGTWRRSRHLTRRELLAAAAVGAVLPSWLSLDRRLAASQSSDPIVPTGPTAPSGDPVRDADVVVGTTLEPESLHPWEARTLAAFDVLDGVMDGLLRYTAEGKLAPALAEQFGISDDGLVYTFRLRQDVRYHNGEPFSGDDFVAAWELSQRREFDALSTLGWQKIDNAELVDDTTLVVTTTEPYAPFLSTVATTYLCPRASLSEGVDSFREVFADTPIGTGPFRITGRERGAGIELGRWDEYWGDRPKLKSVRVRVLADAEALLTSAGAWARFTLPAAVAACRRRELTDALGLADVDVFQLGTMNWQHVDLKQMAFLRETPVRQALDFATPRESIVGDLLAGHAVPAFADQSPESWAYSETLQPRPFDPGQAAKLLDDAGHSRRRRRDTSPRWQALRDRTVGSGG